MHCICLGIGELFAGILAALAVHWLRLRRRRAGR